MKNIIHWCKPKKMWTSHTYKSCAKSPTILINGNWHTETKPNKKDNPRGWIVTDHTNVIINPSEEILESFRVTDKLTYDKSKIEFNINEGNYLLFNNNGCFLLENA